MSNNVDTKKMTHLLKHVNLNFSSQGELFQTHYRIDLCDK